MSKIETLIELVRDQRREAGLTVVWLRNDGSWDEWGFRDEAQRDKFIRSRKDDWHVPAWQ